MAGNPARISILLLLMERDEIVMTMDELKPEQDAYMLLAFFVRK